MTTIDSCSRKAYRSGVATVWEGGNDEMGSIRPGSPGGVGRVCCTGHRRHQDPLQDNPRPGSTGRPGTGLGERSHSARSRRAERGDGGRGSKRPGKHREQLQPRPATVDGTNWGTFVITSDEVTWEGTFRGTIRGGFNQGTFVGHGSDGSLLKGSFTQTGEFEFLLDGVILEPSAE
jgi:hypothetical protein